MVGDIPETVFVEDAVCHPHDVLVLDGTVALGADLDHVGHDDEDLEDGKEMLENVSTHLAITARSFKMFNTLRIYGIFGEV